MQPDQNMPEIKLESDAQSDELLKDALERLGDKTELQDYFPPSCSKGGVME